MNTQQKQLIETNNNLFTTQEQADKTYDTRELLNLFTELEQDGITAIGFSLLVDLVNDTAGNK